MEKKTKSTADLYSEAQKQRDIEVLNVAAENIVSNYGAAYALAKRYDYPPNATANILALTDELCKEFFLLANYILNPAAADIVDTISAKKCQLEKQLFDLSEIDGEMLDFAD